jgi:type IV pilus assembly protein PilE
MKSNQHAGFTLIEVMIAAAIVAIIAMIAIPSYQSQIQSTRRGAAGGCLMEAAQQLERHYTTNLTYSTTFPSLGCVTDQTPNYTFGFTAAPQTTTYVIQASPVTGRADENCGVLTLNQRTQKGAAGGTDPATVKKCWK